MKNEKPVELRKVFFLLTFLFLFGNNCYCQCLTINLIKNGGLEEYNCCPTNMTMINCANYWTQPLIGISTSDYFNTCAIDSLDNQSILPFYQHAYFGNGYAGILCDHFTDPYFYREYIQGIINDSLIANKCYYLEFWTLLGAFASTHAIDALGVYFSDTLPKDINVNTPFYFPSQINNPTGNIISDSINWTKIAGVFIAEGGEKYFTIGTFKHENEINRVEIKTPYPETYFSAYFFDNFSLCPCEDTIPAAPVKPVFEVYPNPAKDDLFVLFYGYDPINTIDLTIYNILGEAILNNQLESSSLPSEVNIAGLSAGCYVLVIKSAYKTFYKDRLVIIR
jgi:hypothetical protein